LPYYQNGSKRPKILLDSFHVLPVVSPEVFSTSANQDESKAYCEKQSNEERNEEYEAKIESKCIC